MSSASATLASPKSSVAELTGSHSKIPAVVVIIAVGI
jgi:hypothetical protein